MAGPGDAERRPCHQDSYRVVLVSRLAFYERSQSEGKVTGDRSCRPASESAVMLPVLTCGLPRLTSVPLGVQMGREVADLARAGVTSVW